MALSLRNPVVDKSALARFCQQPMAAALQPPYDCARVPRVRWSVLPPTNADAALVEMRVMVEKP